jgi:DNA-binding response OmpR family regulator
MMPNLSYAHHRILVIEDQPMLADHIKRSLQRMGALVIGPVSSVSTALGMLDAVPVVDGAILDIDLHDETSLAIADALREREIPFVCTTAEDPAVIPEPYQDVIRCGKPADVRSMVQAILA